MSVEYCDYCASLHDTDFIMSDTVAECIISDLIPGHKDDDIILNAIKSDKGIKLDDWICPNQWDDILLNHTPKGEA